MIENKTILVTRRIVIENVWPQIDCGHFPIKRCAGDTLTVEANIFTEGHDEISALLKYREKNSSVWHTSSFSALGNDRWQSQFVVEQIGQYEYTIEAWINHFKSWLHNMERWLNADQDVSIELKIGISCIEQTITQAKGLDKQKLVDLLHQIKNAPDQSAQIRLLFNQELLILMNSFVDKDSAVDYSKNLKVWVDRERARYSSWYELFPRSLGKSVQEHGTLLDLIQHLPYIRRLGFDVVYLPPIHPIGSSYRKGNNNNPQAEISEPGSPWGIGSAEGGHKSIHPQLGTFADFQQLVERAKENELEIALDFAIQCAPDHPYVKNHPEWFKMRPDGTIQYAENPPKKYQDIYPINFQSASWPDLWEELKSILLFWIEKGIRIFRVDNPHTKAFIFWEWVIDKIKNQYPDVIFLSEAFTRPNVMYYLAKVGFSQSYTYFSWRNSKSELTSYITELTQSPLKEFFRPNFWPNTPDILPEYLQNGGRPAFIIRLVLAATLTASYGIYGPAFELCVNEPRELGCDEYLNSEKYEITHWNLQIPINLKNIITTINKIRKNNLALQYNDNLEFHSIDNDQLICYSKVTPNKNNIIIVVVNLDPNHTQTGWLNLPLERFGVNAHESFAIYDLLNHQKYLWQGSRNFIKLDPQLCCAHIFSIHSPIHEQDFASYE